MCAYKTRTWFIPTSPRSPGKIRNELILLSKFDNLNWWAKDKDGNLINQLEFAKMLEESDFYEGAVSENYADFAARDRLRAPQMMGFAYVDNKGILHVTDAGKQLIEGQRIETLFLKQLLKLQFPSWQHGGNKKTRFHYKVDEMDIFPFVETLRILQAVGGVTKEELAMFILPVLSRDKVDSAIKNFLKYQAEKNKVAPGRERAEFIDNYYQKIYSEIYQEDINSGNIHTRQGSTSTVDEFIRKKMRNSRDYADSCFPYFQYTGLFSRTEQKLVLSPKRKDEINRILSDMKFVLNLYEDVSKFYAEFGDPNLPHLPWENVNDLQSQIENTMSDIEKARQKIKVQIPSVSLEPIQQQPVPTLNNLIEYSYELRAQLRTTNEQVLSVDLGTPMGLKEIIDTYDRVVKKQVVEPPLFMEWNTWRAFLALDAFRSLKPNMELDDSLMPISVAGGRKADLEAYYFGDYVVLVEVTLTYGERQYDTEAEPVTRHVARFQEKEASSGGKKVFGLFIAPKIHDNTLKYFVVHLQHKLTETGEITIVPMPLLQFESFVAFCINNKNTFSDNSFRELMEKIEKAGKSLPDGQATKWSGLITEILNNWENKQLKKTQAVVA
jgi:hypothetical protein